MKINEILTEEQDQEQAQPPKVPFKQRLKTVGKELGSDALSGVGSFLSGLIGGVGGGLSHAMKHAPSSLGADTKLVVDPKDAGKIANKADILGLASKLKSDFSSTNNPDGSTTLTDPAGEKITWDPKKRTLTVSGEGGEVVYQKLKTGKGWKDMHTDDIIKGSEASELDTMFDVASGRVAPPKPKQPQAKAVKPIQVKLPNTGVIVTKSDTDGKWRLPDGTEITDPANINNLENSTQAKTQRQNRQMGR